MSEVDEAKRHRREKRALVRFLEAVGASVSPGRMVIEAMAALHPMLGHEEAQVVQRVEGRWFVARSSPSGAEGTPSVYSALVDRLAQRRVTAGNAAELAPELELDGSVLVVKLWLDEDDIVCVLGHPHRGCFGRRQVALMERVVPVLERTTSAVWEALSDHADEHLARFPDANPTGVVRVHPSGRVIYANPAAARSLGVRAGQLLSRRLREALADPDNGFDQDGRHYQIAVNESTEQGHTDVYLTDQTERREAERETAGYNELVQALVAAQDQGLLLEDGERRLVLVNPALRRMFALESEDEGLLARGASSVAALERIAAGLGEAHALHGWIHSFAAEDTERRLELALPGERVVELDFRPVEVLGKPGGHMWHFREVTAERQLERLLRDAKARAEAADRAKSEFLAHMSHEIRTPMNAVIGMTELLLGTELSPLQRSYAESVQGNSEALLELIADVLDISKIESGTIDLVEAPFSLVDLVEELALSYATRTKPGVAVYVSADPSLPAQVTGDRGRLRQVLANFISNAVKYTDQGEIELQVRVLACADERCRLRLAVRDTGIGIPYAEQERVFERFGQSRTTSREGTGLGLHISTRLAELMGAELGLVSRPGAGSTFTIELELGISLIRDATLEALVDSTRGMRVVLLSTRASQRRAVRAALSASEVDFETGEEALSASEREVVVFDDTAPPAKLRSLASSGRPLLALQAVGSAVAASPEEVAAPVLLTPPKRTRLLEAIYAAWKGEQDDALLDAQAVAEPTEEHAAPLRVLVVDDNPDNRMVAKFMLDRQGHLVQLAESGEEAVERVQAGGVDVVLMDLAMPGIGGIEATRRIRDWEQQEGRAQVPVIAFSAHATLAARDEAFEAGCVDFVAKPAKPGELTAALQRATAPTARVLCVDDAADSRRLMQHYLLRNGYLAPSEASGEAALDHLERTAVDLVLMDVEMPGRGGDEIVAEIRARGWDLPVIAATGHTSAEVHARLRNAGFDDVIVKPIRSENLLRIVDHWLQRAQQETVPPPPERDEVAGYPTVARVETDLEPLVAAFLDNRREDVDAVRTALDSGDWELVRRAGHSMKGTGSAYGFHPVSHLGEALETAATLEDVGSAREAIDALASYLARVQVKLV